MVSSAPQDVGGRILIAECNPLVVAALRGVFSDNARFSIADTARTSAELCEKLSFVEGDCVLLSWQLDDAEAPDVVADISRLGLDPRIVLFADTSDPSVQRDG